MSISLEDQISCAKRELAMRKSAYPRWVANGKMKQAEADKETDRMAAILETLQNLTTALRSTASQGTYDEIKIRAAVGFELAEMIVDAHKALPPRPLL